MKKDLTFGDVVKRLYDGQLMVVEGSHPWRTHQLLCCFRTSEGGIETVSVEPRQVQFVGVYATTFVPSRRDTDPPSPGEPILSLTDSRLGERQA